MPKCSCEITSRKREAIIDACAALYEGKAYKDITLKEIGSGTSFTRTSIYNYFSTKEEIFLALLVRDLLDWKAAIDRIKTEDRSLTAAEAAAALAKSLATRVRMLGLLSMNLADIQDNCGPDNLEEFRNTRMKVYQSLEGLLARLNIPEPERNSFFYSFIPFVYGLYPFTATNKKHEDCTIKAGIPCCCECSNIDHTAQAFLSTLLGTLCRAKGIANHDI